MAWTWRMCGPNSRMNRGMSIIWRIRCDGSKLSPIVPPHCSRIRRQMRGVVARLWPPGHSSLLNSIGQFSMVIFRPWSWAKLTMSGQTRRASSQFGVLVLRAVGAHERVDERDVHLLGGGDHVLQVADDLRAMGRVGVERVRVVAETGDRQALGGDLVDDLGGLARRQVRDVDVAACPRTAGSRRSARGQQAISRLSKPLAAAQSATSISGVSGNGAVSRPSFIGALLCGADGDRLADDLDPAPEARALGDRVVDEHLVVAVGEGRVARVLARAAGRDVRVDRPEVGRERVAEALDVAARQARPRRVRPAPIRAGFLIRISLGRSRWPIQSWSGCSESQATDETRPVDLVLERVLPARR